VRVGSFQLFTWKILQIVFSTAYNLVLTAELSQYDLIPLIISSIAVIIIFAFINARQHAIIEIFIKIVIAFFTLETRKARLDIRDNDKFTELKDEGPSILVKKKACLKKKGNI
jgi:hypothetical protein